LGRIKILELIDGGFLGGGQTNVLSIARILDSSVFDIHIAARGGGLFEKKVNELDIPFAAVDLPKMMRTKYLKKLELLHRLEKFDIVHSHGGVAGFYGRTLKKHFSKLKSIHTIHGLHYMNSGNFLRRGVSKIIEQYLVQYTDMTICETGNDYLIALRNRIADKDKTVIIPNAVNVSEYANLKKDYDLINNLGFTKDNFIIGNISRFDEQKNQKLIIQAGYFLVRKYPEIRFVFIGSGSHLRQMQDLVRESNLEDYIMFTGESSGLKKYYSIFDIFVFPTLWEGMPFVMLEAMAARRAIICSNIPNLLELVKPNHSALVIDPNNMDDLFQKISSLHANSELRETLAQNAMIESTQYDESEIVPRVGKLYERVMG
jgi:glycosyltransferase involved in cell wall biosynthesis